MRNILANVGWIFFDRLFRMISGMLVSIWIARYLGPVDFGILNYANLFPTIFTTFVSLGLTNILMVEYVSASNDQFKQHQLVSTGIVMRLIAGFAAYCLILGLNYFFYRNDLLFILINITGTALIFQSSEVIDIYFQSQTKAKLSVVVKLVSFAIATSIRAYALISQRSIIFFTIINIVELVIAYCLILITYLRYTNQNISLIWSFVNLKLGRDLLMIAWPIMFSEFFVFIYMKIDQFMIESLSTNQQLGLYGAALRLSESWYFIAIAVSSSLYPKIAELWLTNKIKFYKSYESLLTVLVYISILLALLTSVFADFLIEILYGGAYNGAGVILSVHIWAGVFVFIGVGTSNLIIKLGLQKFVLIKTICAALINVVLNFWFIPKYGALGASIATLISYGISAYAMNILNKSAKSIFYLQSKSFINFFTLKNPLSSYNLSFQKFLK